MKRAITHGLIVLAFLTMAAVFGYLFYAQVTSPPYKDWGLPAIIVAFIVGNLVYYFAFKDYRSEGAPDVQLQVRPPAPKPAPSSTQTTFMAFGMVFMVIFGLYWRHTFHSSERTLSIDAWWPVVLPVATVVAAVAWLTDTLFLRIINGSYSGRSQAALRSALTVKRLAVAVVAFAALYGLGIWHLYGAQEAYRSALAQAWLAGVPALIISLIVIRR